MMPEQLEARKHSIEERLDRGIPEDTSKPMFSASNIHFELAERTHAINDGGIGLLHELARQTGLIDAIDNNLHLLKIHAPYHESDHVLNVAYNALCGGHCLEDIELRRNNETFLDALGTDRIPDPTTAGDFCRRFDSGYQIHQLQVAIDEARLNVWHKQPEVFFKQATIDMDGHLVATTGECKEGMDISYNGTWGYHPLLLSLAETGEVLRLVNRSGNRPSHEGAARQCDQVIVLCREAGFKRILLRGDTDFSLTANFDRWSKQVDYLFGMDAHPVLVRRAQDLDENAWKRLQRKEKYTTLTGQTRERYQCNEKQRIVVEREYLNLKLNYEDIAEFSYRPGKCSKDYRMVVVRKNITKMKGERALFDEIRYFFYITTRDDLSTEQVVRCANQRCDQENVIEELKNGVNALRMPLYDLVSNWAYMVIAALAWNIKSWFAMMMHLQQDRQLYISMEFRRFLHSIILIPCRVVRRARSVVIRLIGYQPTVDRLFSTWQAIERIRFG